MEPLIIFLAVFIVALLLISGFRKAVREGKVGVPNSGRFGYPVINPNGESPVDTGYWREKYRREHEQGQGLFEYALFLVFLGAVVIIIIAILVGPTGGKKTDAQGTPFYTGDNAPNFQNLTDEIRALHQDVYGLQTQVARLDKR